MKYTFFILASLFSLISDAQTDYTFEDIAGKWVELTRTDRDAQVIPFKDTMFIEIRNTGFFLIRKHMGATMYGEAELQENVLTFRKEKFTIEKKEGKLLKLKKGNQIHRFELQDEFRDDPGSKTTPQIEANNKILIDKENIVGKWSVYKKTDPSFDRKRFYLKILDIKEYAQNLHCIGEITMHNMDSLYFDASKIHIEKQSMKIIGEKTILNLSITKNDGEELILTDDKVTYFLKRFGR